MRADLLPGEYFRALTRYELLVSGAVGREGPGWLVVRVALAASEHAQDYRARHPVDTVEQVDLSVFLLAPATLLPNGGGSAVSREAVPVELVGALTMNVVLWLPVGVLCDAVLPAGSVLIVSPPAGLVVRVALTGSGLDAEVEMVDGTGLLPSLVSGGVVLPSPATNSERVHLKAGGRL